MSASIALIGVFALLGCVAPTATPSPTAPVTASPAQSSSPPPASSTPTTTAAPTSAPTSAPTEAPTAAPTEVPTVPPTVAPTAAPAPPTFGAPTQIAATDLADLRVAMDGAGAAHVIGTTERKGRGLLHLTNSSGVWTEEEVTTPPAKGSDNTIVVARDTDGSLWVGFARYEIWNPCFFECRRPFSRLDGLYVINNASGTWSEPARLPDEFGDEFAMAVRDGVLHVAYRLDGDPPQIGYATNGGGEWQFEVAGPGFWPDLALGGAGDPRIVMVTVDGEIYGVTLAVRSKAGWQVEPVPDSTGDPTSPHLAVNSAGATVVEHAHFEPDRGYVSVLTTFDGTGWSAPAEIAPEAIDEMTLGPGDAVHVIFARADTDASDGLWWAWRHGETRVDQLIDASTRVVEDGPSAPQSFALDAAGLPHIIYAIPYDEGREGLWYVSGGPP